MKRINSRLRDTFSEPIREREREILKLIAEHHTNKEIAVSLHLALSTVKWYTRQIYSKLAVENRRAAVERAIALDLLNTDNKKVVNNLPSPLTPFVSREEEIAEIVQLLSQKFPRLITLYGPGGSGKTRLAIQAATSVVNTGSNLFPQGVWFIELAPLQNPDSILQAISNVLGYTFFDREKDHFQQLLNYLAKRHTLLILDNFEHLLSNESLRLVTAILSHAPHVKLMVTSRSRLNVAGEQLFQVEGMETPDKYQPEENWGAFGALQLFMECARRTQPRFEINNENAQSIVQICQFVEGMPLAIELATAWLEILTPQEILAEMERNLGFLQVRLIEQRHQSLRMVFNTSWKLLSKEEQHSIMALTVFSGSFSREAAQKVSGTSLEVLLSLVNKSWLAKDTRGRYHIHELLRQFGYENLLTNPQVWSQAKNSHAYYYATLMNKLGEEMKGIRQIQAFDLIELEFENIRAAWNWFSEHGYFSVIVNQMLLALVLFCAARWRARDILNLTEYAREMMVSKSNDEDTEALNAVLILVELAFHEEYFILRKSTPHELVLWSRGLPIEKLTFAWNLLLEKHPDDIDGLWLVIIASLFGWYNHLQQSIQRLKELQRIFDKKHNVWLQGIVKQNLGRLLLHYELNSREKIFYSPEHAHQESWNEAMMLLYEALLHFQTTGDRSEQGHTLHVIATLEPSPEKAYSLLLEAKRLLEDAGDIPTSIFMLHELADLSIQQGNFKEGFSYFREEQKIYKSLGYQRFLAHAFTWESVEALRYSSISHARRAREAQLAILRKELDAKYSQGVQKLDHRESIYGWGCWELGEIERVAGHMKKAMQYYDQANQIFERLQIPPGKAFYHRGIGDVAQAQGDYETAMQQFQVALEVSQSIPHTWMEAYALCGLGRAAIGLEQPEKAMNYFIMSLQISRQLNNHGLIMIAFSGLASCLLSTGQKETAIELGCFVIHHSASWNETRKQTRNMVNEACLELPHEVVESAMERGKKAVLEDIFNQLLEVE